jgi:hypothetical protein
MVYVSCIPTQNSHVVSMYEWEGGGGDEGTLPGLVHRGTLDAVGVGMGRHRPLAYLPSFEGGSCSGYLVVGTCNSAEVSVVSLPGHTLVRTHTLPRGMRVYGLAGDPCGTALAVLDAGSHKVHVLPWPLSD